MHTTSRACSWRHAAGAAVLAIAAGCSTSPTEASRAVDSAVRIEAEGCHSRPSIGGGSFVDPTHVLTVAHVVAGSDDIDVVLSNGTEADGHVVAINRKKDLA
ncbi:MAG: hypothetical protein RLZ14_782, partial [Actinomycetota bacterium]